MATKVLKKKQLGVEPVEPALTPASPSDTTFLRKPKLGPQVKKKEIPEGLWTKCPSCGALIYDKELDENLKVCTKCQHHFPIGARERIHSLVETCTFEEMDAEIIEKIITMCKERLAS
jgi:acetyl-CoA carboxylase carboxyl transferase subunit beta